MPEPEPFGAPPDRAAELPLSSTEQVLADCVERLGVPRIRHAARSAFEHLRKSWTLHPIDSEMSLFRAITGEEEAATALILALRQQNYPGAQRLNPRDHRHKIAVWPLILAIGRGLERKGIPTPSLRISKEGEPKLTLNFDIGTAAGLDEPFFATPDHPFNFVMHSDEKGPFEVHRWERELAEIASERGFADIRKHIESEANLRTRILYASNDGIPAVRFADDAILSRVNRVAYILKIVVGVMQTKQHQLFVTQGLEALLRALNRLEDQGYAFPVRGFYRDVPHVSLTEDADRKMRLRLITPTPRWLPTPYKFSRLADASLPSVKSVTFEFESLLSSVSRQ
jgi:hypothetical protein